MYKHSRKRITIAIMGSLILFFALLLGVILMASYQEISRKNNEMLDRYIEIYSLENQPGEDEGPSDIFKGSEVPGDMPPDYQLSTFYSVAMDENGTVLAIDEGRKTFRKEELLNTAAELISQGRESGKKGNLKYRLIQKEGYTLVAFIDVTLVENDMHALIRNVIIIGSLSMFLMLFVSIWLSERIIGPLEENDKRQKQFISDASHELKTPITIIDTNAELLSRQIKENEWLSNIKYESQRMGELVKRLLDLSHTEKTSAEKERIDFSRIVERGMLTMESLAYECGKTICSDIQKGITLMADESQMSRLMSILLDNAIGHSAEHSEIGVLLNRERNHAVLRIINEGEEIPAEMREHLFDRFYRIDQARNSKGDHYGLGLAIAKAIVEAHEGNIDLSCYDGKVEFCVRLPMK